MGAVLLGGTPYQYDGNACRLTWECKLPILVGRKANIFTNKGFSEGCA